MGGQPQQLTGDGLWQRFLTQEVLPYETDRDLVQTTEGIMKYRRESPTETQLYMCNLGVTESSFELKTGHSCLTQAALDSGQNHISAIRVFHLILLLSKK